MRLGHGSARAQSRGFTLVELLLVLLIVAMLASLVAPVVTGSIRQAKESALKKDLHVMRQAIDDHFADTGGYPGELEELVKKRYLRRIPPDPITERRETWELVREGDGPMQDRGDKRAQGIIDVRSGSDQIGSDGVSYKEW